MADALPKLSKRHAIVDSIVCGIAVSLNAWGFCSFFC